VVIELKKGRDGRSTMACVRKDGSRTWARVHPFFPVHDLTHCAVESVFGFREAFFGLVESGWEIDRFERPEGRRGLPSEALWAECIVGLLDRDRVGDPLTVAEFSEALAAAVPALGVPAFRAVTEAELRGVRALRDELAERWRALSPGATLAVPFPAAAAVAA
jgi:hypothetical protein